MCNTNQNIEITVESTEMLETLFLGFIYSEICSTMTPYERGRTYEEFLQMRDFIKRCEKAMPKLVAE